MKFSRIITSHFFIFNTNISPLQITSPFKVLLFLHSLHLTSLHFKTHRTTATDCYLFNHLPLHCCKSGITHFKHHNCEISFLCPFVNRQPHLITDSLHVAHQLPSVFQSKLNTLSQILSIMKCASSRLPSQTKTSSSQHDLYFLFCSFNFIFFLLHAPAF